MLCLKVVPERGLRSGDEGTLHSFGPACSVCKMLSRCFARRYQVGPTHHRFIQLKRTNSLAYITSNAQDRCFFFKGRLKDRGKEVPADTKVLEFDPDLEAMGEGQPLAEGPKDGPSVLHGGRDKRLAGEWKPQMGREPALKRLPGLPWLPEASSGHRGLR